MWISPDGKIHKLVIEEGEWGTKPSEQTECEVIISDCPKSFLEYNNSNLVIGDTDGQLRRTLDICLITMNEQETAKFTVLSDSISFTIKLVHIKFHGYIYQWDAKMKFEIAQNYKEKGVELYNLNRGKDAAHRFIKALKIISSIPLDAETTPTEIDAVSVVKILKLKSNLFNNLASYYLKKGSWLLTIDACKKVLEFDENNVKAHYKLAVAYINDRNFEEAEKELNIVLMFEPNNTAAIEHMKHVKEEIQKANMKFNLLVKKMFN